MLSCQKAHFSLPEDQHYLNCAYMSPLARTVEAAGMKGMLAKRNPAAITADDFFADSVAVRSAFAGLIGTPEPDRIALLPAASYGLATVARNTPVEAGQNLVVLHEQFPSNIYTWQRLASDHGAAVRTVHPPAADHDRGRAWNQRLLEAIDSQTAVVALPHVHWADGTLFDLEAIGTRARAVGAAFVIDGTQSVGALPLDLEAVQPDALICAAYKWLMGPYSIGLAYYGPRYDDGVPIEENWINRRGSEDFAGLVAYEPHYQPGAGRYDVGERSNFILLPMLRAALGLLHEWGIEAVQPYCQALLADVIAEARSLGFQVEADDQRGHHLFGLRLPKGLSTETLTTHLRAHRVSVSMRGAAVRVSPHLYNDAADAEALLAALQAAVR